VHSLANTPPGSSRARTRWKASHSGYRERRVVAVWKWRLPQCGRPSKPSISASTARKYGSHSIPWNMCTATKPLSRPAAVLSIASSRATVRTSIGKGTRKPSRGISSRIAATASAVRSRGSAYSISVKRTRRGLVKIEAERSTRTDRPASRVTSRFSCGILAGKRRPRRQSEPKAWLVSSTSLAYAFARPRGRACSPVRLLVRVSATSACGKTKNSKWSLASARSSKPASTSDSAAGSSTPLSVNAGTQRSVTSAIAPSAPRPTRAARNTSGSCCSEQASVEPSARTRVSSTTCEEMLRSREPVPCVAVEIAPAMLWTSMSPRFSIARPWRSSCALSSAIVMPVCTLTSPDAGSASSTRVMFCMPIIAPSVSAMSLKECPEPATRTRKPRSAASPTASASSCTPAGAGRRAGEQAWSPAQLRQPGEATFRSVGSGIVDEPEPTASQAARPAGTLRARPGPRRATVVGAGSFGTALALLLERGGLRTTLQTRSTQQAQALESDRENAAYLPGVPLPAGLRVETAAAGAARADYVFLAVPSRALGEAIDTLVAVGLGARTALVSVAKGLVPPAGTPPTVLLGERFGAHRVACLGGPAHAREMVREGAALVAASFDEELARSLSQMFNRAGVVCEQSDDPVGVELAG